MDFYAILDQVIALLRQRQRVTYRALQRQFGVGYFPAYELVNDVLRDYRYFEADGVHPNRLAVDQVWDFQNGKPVELYVIKGIAQERRQMLVEAIEKLR